MCKRPQRVRRTASGNPDRAAVHRPHRTVLQFTDLTTPVSVAVDSTGNLYVADYGNDRVLKLAAQ